MKKIKWFDTLAEYREYVEEHVIATHIFKEHPFYRGLTDFIIDNRSPIFFEQSEDCEQAHFTQYFNFVLHRTNYQNRFLEDMYYMHDFMHMAFDNPINIKNYSLDYFSEIANHNEYVASNETEILTYYRLPQMRKKSFQGTILYDVFHKNNPGKPSASELLSMRKNIALEGGDGGLEVASEDEVRALDWVRKFKENNTLWCKTWHENFPQINSPYSEKRVSLPILNYEYYLEHYHAVNSEKRFQENIIKNINTGLALLGAAERASSFAEAKELVHLFENKIIMRESAELFHELYLSNKEN